MKIRQFEFGRHDGVDIQRFVCESDYGLSLKLTDYGVLVLVVRVPDTAGQLANVSLGPDKLGDFLESPRLAALVPRPRANLTRFHGVFAGAPDRPNSKHRALVTPSKRGKSAKRQINGDERSPVEQHAAMTSAQRLKRGLSPLIRSAVIRKL